MQASKQSESAPAMDRAFLEVVTRHANGATVSEASAALKQLAAAVEQTGRAGKVTLTMSLRPAGKGTGGTMVFETEVKATPPRADNRGSIFYVDGDFNLVREDPNQIKLDLRVAEVPGENAAPLRRVTDETEATHD